MRRIYTYTLMATIVAGCSGSDAGTTIATPAVADSTTTATSTTVAATTTVPDTAPTSTIARDTAIATRQCIDAIGSTLLISRAWDLGDTQAISDALDECDDAVDLLDIDGADELKDDIGYQRVELAILNLAIVKGEATQDDVDKVVRDTEEFRDKAERLLDEGLGRES